MAFTAEDARRRIASLEALAESPTATENERASARFLADKLRRQHPESVRPAAKTMDDSEFANTWGNFMGDPRSWDRHR